MSHLCKEHFLILFKIQKKSSSIFYNIKYNRIEVKNTANCEMMCVGVSAFGSSCTRIFPVAAVVTI